MRDCLKKFLLYPLLISFGLIVTYFHNAHVKKIITSITVKDLLTNAAATHEAIVPVTNSTLYSSPKYLSYQPPGNGWNNQRIALEGALLMAKLLNRTLLVHPLSSHQTGENKKKYFDADKKFGHIAYNRMHQSNLLPLSTFLDLDLMSRLIPVEEFNLTHKRFLESYSHLRWHRVCHSMGYGYWADRRPITTEERRMWNAQVFVPTQYWQGKCPIEMEEAKHGSHEAMVKFIADFENDNSDILYIEEGTLFGIQFRFMSMKDTLKAQQWVTDYVKYKKSVYERANIVKERLGDYNALHVRRVEHIGNRMTHHDWLFRIFDKDLLPDTPLYVATDEPDLTWFNFLEREGFTLYFAKDFQESLNFSYIHETVRQDFLGIHEQIICELSNKFVSSEHSTFSIYVNRLRGELDSKDGLYMEGMHSYWIGHTFS